MDMYPLAKALHEARLHESKKMQHYGQIMLDGPHMRTPLKRWLLLRIGDLLIVFGNQLKASSAAYVERIAR